MSTTGAVGTAQVPEGHKVVVFGALAEPKLVETDGGVLLAHLGLGSDDARSELEELARRVEEALQRPRRQVLVSEHRGPLSGLFAPSNPAVAVTPAVITWIFHSGSADAWAGRFEQLVERLRSTVTRAPSGARSLAYFVDRASSRVKSLAMLLAGAQVPSRTPEADGALLLEVHRPEGVVISAFSGTSVDTSGAAVVEAQDPAHTRAKRAPRLRHLVLAASGGASDATWRALMEELLGREWPFLLVADPAGRVQKRQWPGSEPSFPAYSDEQSFGWSVEDLGAAGPVCMAAMAPPALFAWAAKSGAGVALNAYRERAVPVYLVLRADQIVELAGGRIPPRAPTNG